MLAPAWSLSRCADAEDVGAAMLPNGYIGKSPGGDNSVPATEDAGARRLVTVAKRENAEVLVPVMLPELGHRQPSRLRIRYRHQ
jgi:hypothetical protein